MTRYIIGSTAIYLLCVVTYSVAWTTAVHLKNGTCIPQKFSSRICGNQSEIVHADQTLELLCPNGTQYRVLEKISSNETFDKLRCWSGKCPENNKLEKTQNLFTNCTGSTQTPCNETIQIASHAEWPQNETHFAEIVYECLTDNVTNVTEAATVGLTLVTSSVTASVSTAPSTGGSDRTVVTSSPRSGTDHTVTAIATPAPITPITPGINTSAPTTITTTYPTATNITSTTTTATATILRDADMTKPAPPPSPDPVTTANQTTMTSRVPEAESSGPGKPEIYIIIIVGAAVLVAVGIVAAVIIRRRRKRKQKALIPNEDVAIKATWAKGQTLGDDNQRHSNSGYTEINLDDDTDDTRMPPDVISGVMECALAIDGNVKSDGFGEKAETRETLIDAHREEEKSKKNSNGHTLSLLIDRQTVGKEQGANGKRDEEIRQKDETEERKVQHKADVGNFTEIEQIYVNSEEGAGPYVNQNGAKQTALENGQIYPVETNPNQNPYHSLELLPQEDSTDTADVVFLRGGQQRPFLSSSDPVGGLTAPNSHETKVRCSAGSNFSSSDRESDHYYSEIKDSILVDEDNYTVPDEAVSRKGAARRISEGDYEAVDFEYDEEAGDHATTMYKAAKTDGRGVAAVNDEAFDDSDEVLIIENDTYESTAAISDDKDRGHERIVADTKILQSLDPHPEPIVTCSESCSPSEKSKEQTVPDERRGDGSEKNNDDSDEEGFMFDNDIYIPFNT